ARLADDLHEPRLACVQPLQPLVQLGQLVSPPDQETRSIAGGCHPLCPLPIPRPPSGRAPPPPPSGPHPSPVTGPISPNTPHPPPPARARAGPPRGRGGVAARHDMEELMYDNDHIATTSPRRRRSWARAAVGLTAAGVLLAGGATTAFAAVAGHAQNSSYSRAI